MKNNLIAIIIAIMIIYSTTIAYGYPNNIIIMVTPQSMEYHLENSIGNISGYTPNGIFQQIPEITLYRKYSMDTSPEPAMEYEKFNRLESRIIPSNISSGKYKLVLYGTSIPVNTAINVELSWSEGQYPRYSKYHFIYPNVIWSYEFDIPATLPANGQIILTKVSTPADLIKDITIAGQLGYIGNAHFVSETIEKINEIEKERAKPAEKDDDHKLTPAQKAKKEYTELLDEITEKYNKPEADEFVKKEAYDVLKEDIEYIIGHL